VTAPSAHLIQVVWAFCFEKDPKSHDEQLLEAVDGLKVPGKQGPHVAEADNEKYPGKHAGQERAPDTFEAVPAGHDEHLGLRRSLIFRNRPGLHSTQEVPCKISLAEQRLNCTGEMAI
jgi:hypothetical protein